MLSGNMTLAAAALKTGHATISPSLYSSWEPPMMEQFAMNIRSLRQSTHECRDAPQTPPHNLVDIGMYIHIISSTDDQSKFTDEIVDDQMEEIHEAFRPTNFTFHLREINRDVNESWAFGRDIGVGMEELHRGTQSSLNLIIIEDLAGRFGMATMPSETYFTCDSVVISFNTLPGGSDRNLAKGRRAGRIAVHEIGHWLGLEHTFEGGCEGDDGVGDTPHEANPADTCDPRDSCPDQPGSDSVTNYMNFSRSE